ncbi:MAG TPA: adenosylcobinamide-GDP ribazoletransferase [Alphaproteobacteria bacterium]|nr:adenosylcobinamide-GDP ribazoletransferase [Alphaproteobacteria bacterium]
MNPQLLVQGHPAYNTRMSDDSQNTPPAPPPLTIKPPSPENMWAEISIAVNYLTRFNLSLKEEPKPRLIRKAMAWFPLIGAAIGMFGASIDWIMTQMRMPGIITSTFAVIGMLWVTRALHEEEFASLVNQYGRELDKEQKIGWLKEERSVRYGTLGIILIIIMKIGAIASLADNSVVFQALIVACSWSRALMVVATAWLRPLEGDPVADHFIQPPATHVAIALGLGAVIAFAVLGEDMAPALLAGTISGLIVALIGANHLRGYNGPLLGTLQQIVEITVLGVVLAIQ